MNEDLFGNVPEALTAEEQAEMFGTELGPQLVVHEANARELVHRLAPRVAADVATQKELEQYKQALALLRRHLPYSEEEITIRLRKGESL